MRFTPMNEDELSLLLPAGDYEFVITGAEEKTSKAGNDMIILTLKVYDHDGGTRILTDYVLSPNDSTSPDNVKRMTWKIKNICEAVGLEEKYNAGEIEDFDFKDKIGVVTVAIQTDKTKQYPDKNVAKKYHKIQTGVENVKANNTIEDDLPF